MPLQRGLRPRNRSVKSAFIALTLHGPLAPTKIGMVECKSNPEKGLEPEPESEADPILIARSKWLRAQRLETWVM